MSGIEKRMKNLKRWPKGVSGNPNGRPKLPQDVVEARKLNRNEVERILTRHVRMTKTELESAQKDPNTPALENLIVGVLLEGMKSGDHVRLNFLLDRLIGKPTEHVELEQRTISHNEIFALVKELESTDEIK